jgi:hypothetical protein
MMVRKITDITRIMTVISVLLLSSSLFLAAAAPAVYAQLQQQQGTPDTAYDFMGEADEDTKRMFIELAISQIQNMTNPSISVSEDGTLSISYFPPSGDTNGYISVTVPHPFTNENGYEVNNGILVAPNGTQIFP